jgi:Nickel-dependent hydrogenase
MGPAESAPGQPRALAERRAWPHPQRSDRLSHHLELLPRDAAGTAGALEQALVGTPAGEGETMPLFMRHVVRSFNPCMVCTVH